MRHSTWFISDLHLSPDTADTATQFLQFLQYLRETSARALYVLGDFFDAWIGDDLAEPFHFSVMDGLRALVDSGIPVYVMPGNRDFLLGVAFARYTGAIMLPDPFVLALPGQSVLLMHGDSLCSGDVMHQCYRRLTRYAWIQYLFLHLPSSTRKKMAKKLRERSHWRNQRVSPMMMDVTSQAVGEAFQQFSMRSLIHGHTHRPAIHQQSFQGSETTRIVLGDWHEGFAQVLRWDEDGRYQLLDIKSMGDAQHS